MTNSDIKIIHPWAIFKESVSVWGRNFLVLTAISCVNVMCSMLLRLPKSPLYSKQDSASLSSAGGPGLLAFIATAALILISVFLSFLMIQYIRAAKDNKGTAPIALPSSPSSLKDFLKSYCLILLFFIGVVLFGAFVLEAGRVLNAKSAAYGVKLGLILSTSLVFVICLIAASWYAFFFSLGPLIAAFEKTSPVVSLKVSRARIKGNALRYLAAMVFVALLYFGIGLFAYFVVTRFTHDKLVLNMIDPFGQALFGPLWVVAWFISYRKLTETRS